MASNFLPRNSGLVIQLGGKMETGIKDVGASDASAPEMSSAIAPAASDGHANGNRLPALS